MTMPTQAEMRKSGLGSRFTELDNEFEVRMLADGSLVAVQTDANGAKKVNPVPGPGTLLRGRWLQLDAIATIESVQWPAGSNITELVFFAKPVAGTAALAGDEYCIVSIDSPTAAAAVADLTQAETTNSDVGFIPINVNEYVRVPLKSPLSAGSLGGGIVYAKTVGGIALDLWIGGY